MDCRGGYARRLLEVDLSTGRVEKAPLDEGLVKDFLGGSGLAARLFLVGEIAHPQVLCQAQVTVRVIGRDDHQGVAPIHVVARLIDDRQGGSNRLVQVPHGADQVLEVVGVIRMVDLTLLDHHEEALVVAR